MKKSKEKSKDSRSSPLAPSLINPYEDSRWSGAVPSETDEDQRLRLQAMEEAAKRSKDIDQFLLEGKKALERRKRAVKILLLGQSESGKSSVLKNFQLTFAPKHFEDERSLWKIIVQLNVIGTIKTIFDALEEEFGDGNGHYGSPTPADSSLDSPLRVYRRTRLGLSPLSIIESNLLKTLAPECTDSREMVVRAGDGWKSLLRSRRNPLAFDDDRADGRRRSHPHIGAENDPASILIAQKDDILALWSNPSIQEILRTRQPKLRQSAGFFMDDIARIATPNYVPSDRDIIRARVRTMGVEEHHFVVEKGREANIEYYIIDVGGARSQRASWAPFFDDVQAIVFLAPLIFNQSLEEDNRVNRIEDSLFLWKDICSSKLLANAHLILFLNKKDILAATLKAGFKVKKYVPTYGDNPNDVPSVTKYFKDKFRVFHKKYSPEVRPFMCYETSAIDIKSMGIILAGVRDSILHQHLREGDMI